LRLPPSREGHSLELDYKAFIQLDSDKEHFAYVMLPPSFALANYGGQVGGVPCVEEVKDVSVEASRRRA